MPTFTYKGIDAQGDSAFGEIDASDRKRAVRQLTAQGVRPTQVTLRTVKGKTPTHAYEAEIEAITAEPTEQSARKKRSRRVRLGSHIALGFLQKLLVLLKSGLPLGDSLRLLSARLSDPAMQEMAQQLWRKISEGRTLASAMSDYPKVFSESSAYLIAAGEASGNLVNILERIVAYMEESKEMRRKVLSSLAYPAMIVCVSIGVVGFLLFYLMPRIRQMLSTLGGELNILAKILVGGSEFAVQVGPYLIGILIIVSLAIWRWRQTETGRSRFDQTLLRIPFFGNLYLCNNIFQTTSLMSTLLRSGVTTTETLKLVERTIPNTHLRSKFAFARKQIQEGVSMATAIKRVRYMPDMSLDILSVGENTGNISQSLDDVNKVTRDELNQRLALLTTMISVVSMCIAFSLVTLIALATVFSVFSITQSIQL